MNDQPTAPLVGDPVEVIVKPKTRRQRVADWRREHKEEYEAAYRACCVCTPTRAQALLVDQWHSPPVD